MDELISKKDLLIKTGISYGQLYRWKRKKLIPEEWFIKKSSFTGQETFFPKKEILERIELILNEKDNLDLDTLSYKLSSNIPHDFEVNELDAIKKSVIKESTLNNYLYLTNKKEVVFKDIFIMDIIEDLINLNEKEEVFLKEVINILDEKFEDISNDNYEVIYFNEKSYKNLILVRDNSYIKSIRKEKYRSGNLKNKIVEIKNLLG